MNKPKLTLWIVDYYEAFQFLASSRMPVDGRVSEIPYQAISMYLTDMQITGVDDKLSWLRIIREVDACWCKLANAKIAEGRKKNSGKSRR